MTFFHPVAFLWLLLAIPIALLYLRPYRPTRVVVSTAVPLDQGFSRDRGPFGMVQAAAHWVSLALQLTALGLVVLALAEPSLRPAETIVVVIDNRTDDDHAMAQSSDWTIRFERAKRLAAERVDAMEDHDQAALLSTGDVLRVRCGITGSREDLRRAIDCPGTGRKSRQHGRRPAAGPALDRQGEGPHPLDCRSNAGTARQSGNAKRGRSHFRSTMLRTVPEIADSPRVAVEHLTPADLKEPRPRGSHDATASALVDPCGRSDCRSGCRVGSVSPSLDGVNPYAEREKKRPMLEYRLYGPSQKICSVGRLPTCQKCGRLAICPTMACRTFIQTGHSRNPGQRTA